MKNLYKLDVEDYVALSTKMKCRATMSVNFGIEDLAICIVVP